MPNPVGVRRVGAAACACALLLSLAACAAPSRTGAGSATPTSAPGPTRGVSPAPGLERASDGTGVAFGWVMRSDLEGGFWALVDRPATESRSGQPRTIVVLLPGLAGEAAIARLEGSYVRASGTLSDGPSTRMAGPEMKVDSIAGAVDYVP